MPMIPKSQALGLWGTLLAVTLLAAPLPARSGPATRLTDEDITRQCRGLPSPAKGAAEPMHFRSAQPPHDDERAFNVNGGFRIDYDGYTLCADQLAFNREKSELIFSGDVLMLEPDGQVTHADRMTLNEAFTKVFSDSLRKQ
jgi:LPS-assembly protein